MSEYADEVFILGSGFSKAVFARMPLLNDLSIEVANRLDTAGEPIWKRVYEELIKFGKASYGERKTKEPVNFEELLTFLYQDFPWKSEEDLHLSRSLYLQIVKIATEVIKKHQQRPAINKRYMPDSRDVLDLVSYWHYNKAKIISLNYDTILEHLAIRNLRPWLYKQKARGRAGRNQFYMIDAERTWTNPDARVIVHLNSNKSVDVFVYDYEVGLEHFEQAMIENNDKGQPSAQELFNTFRTQIQNARLSIEDFFGVPIANVGRRTASLLSRDKRATLELLKLHGSINWFHSGEMNGSGQIYYLNDADNPSVDWSPNTRDLQPLIIPPVLDKSRFFVHNSVKLLWNQAKEHLKNAKTVYIIGYSIPLTDLTVRLMLKNYLNDDCRVVIVNRDVGKLNEYDELFGPRFDRTFVRNDDNIFVSFVQHEILPRLPAIAHGK